MSAPLWMKNVTRRQRHSGGSLVGGGTRRVTWHITYDALNKDKSPAISFSNVTDYLLSKCFEPHIVWDPVTGEIIQCLPANTSAYALVHSSYPETNRIGDVHIQVEIYFTPGEVRNGKRYDKLTDTPLKNGGEILRYLDNLGIPRHVPLKAKNRDANVWARESGHYGHFSVPENDHTDPVEEIQPILTALAEQTGGLRPSAPEKKPVAKSRPVIGRGDKGRRVKRIQSRLNLAADGVFGPLTEKAVKSFQHRVGLDADGRVGDKTWAAMFPPKGK